MLFPTSLSPEMTSFSVSPFPAAVCIFSASSLVSFLCSTDGWRNMFHVCVALNASAALSWSTSSLGRASMRPSFDGSNMFWAVMASSPSTGSALLLLSVTRFRWAFRSPGAGGLLRSMALFFLNFPSCIFFPARMWPPGRIFARPGAILAFGAVGLLARTEEEEKGAVRTVTGTILWEMEVVVAGRRRHLKPLGTDIVRSVPR